MEEFPKRNNKGEKFKPRKIPRYLPGSLKGDFIASDLKEYNQHLYKVFTATPKIDANPPNFHFEKYMKSVNINALIRIESDNRKLLQKINYINRNGGRIDSFNQNANKHSSRWDLKLKKIEQIDKENEEIYKKLLRTASVYPKSEHDEHWKHAVQKFHMFSKYPFVILDKKTRDQIINQCPSISQNLELSAGASDSRPKCFLEFKIDNGIVLGKVIIELYNDQVPRTVEHFLNLCTSKSKRCLKNCPVSRIIINKYCIAGDPTNFKGKGEKLPPENFNLQHTRPGVISMIPNGENNEISSQFCLTFAGISEFDENCVVIGKIIRGGAVLFKVNGFGTWHGKPITKIVISDCGLCVKKRKK